MTRNRWSWLLAFTLCVPPAVAAQGGAIAGRVADSTRTQPLGGAQVKVQDRAGRTVGTAISGANGSYQVGGLSAGSYSVLVSLIPFAPKQLDNITVQAGGTTTVDVALVAKAYMIEELRVTTVSRVPEKITDAPASITVIPTVQVQERPALSVTDHLQNVPGVAISQGGLLQSNVVARGFNNIFSGALLTLIDNRYASVPSLRVNVPAFLPITNDDIEQVEFVLGPGAALYGPNASSGVLHIITKSPLTSPGTTVSLEGGFRSRSPSAPTGTDQTEGMYRFGFRHATRLSPKVGFKISAEYLKGTDWKYTDRNAAGASVDTLSPGSTPITRTKCTGTFGCRDFNLEKWNGEARLDVKPDENTDWITSYGRAQAVNLIELTGIGAAQARDWRYQYVQSRFRYKELFVQGFGNFSNAGETFLLRDGSKIIDNSRLWALQAQHGFNLGPKETIIYGADYIYTDARTGGTINGANEGDDTIKEIGGYVHSVTKVSPKFDLLTALRIDKHNQLPSAVWSPRVAFVYKPDPDNNLRLTYNRAFSTPTNNNLFLDIAAGQAGPYTVRALGVPKSGFHFRANGGCAGGVDNLCMRPIPLPGVQNQLLPAQATLLWPVLVGIVQSNPNIPANVKALIAAMTPPTAAQVSTTLRRLNATTGQFTEISGTQVTDIDALRPTISNTIELGYKGTVARKARISVDGYFERRQNFVGPLIVESPNVFFDPTTLAGYIISQLTPIVSQAGAAAIAGQLVPGLAGVPFGTVVPNQGAGLTDRPDIFLTYRNFGQVDLWGADLALDYIANDHWSFAGTFSWVNKDFFSAADVNGPTDIALNSSKSRGSGTVRFRNDRRGWATEARFRAVKGFPVNSGVFVSPQRSDGSFIPTDSYGVFDLQGSWRPSFGARNMLVTATVNNVFNKAYATFVGVPKLGRMFLTKVSYTF